MKLIGLLLLLSLISLVEGKVVTTDPPFNLCPDAFVENNGKHVPPTVLDQNRYKQICQKYEKAYRYATLYDTQNKIPVYSAYHWADNRDVDIEINKKKHKWMIEPQLDVDATSENEAMDTESNIPGSSKIIRQALGDDYSKANAKLPVSKNTGEKENRWNKGHLYPVCHTDYADLNQVHSSYTLTNAAPQRQLDNTAWYHKVELEVECSIRARCAANTAYVVTGAIPGPETPVNKLNGRVNVPSYFWSAYCCRDRMNPNQFISQGYRMKMNVDGKGMVWYYGTVSHADRPINKLNKALKADYALNTPFQIFGEVPGCGGPTPSIQDASTVSSGKRPADTHNIADQSAVKISHTQAN